MSEKPNFWETCKIIEILRKKEVFMNPAVHMLINGILSAIFAVMKAQGLSEEEAKAVLAAKVAQIEQLPPLPMDI